MYDLPQVLKITILIFEIQIFTLIFPKYYS